MFLVWVTSSIIMTLSYIAISSCLDKKPAKDYLKQQDFMDKFFIIAFSVVFPPAGLMVGLMFLMSRWDFLDGPQQKPLEYYRPSVIPKYPSWKTNKWDNDPLDEKQILSELEKGN